MLDCFRTQPLKKVEDNIKKKTFTYSEKSEEKRAEFLEKLEKVPEHKQIYVDECGIHKHLVREHGRAVRGAKIQNVKRGRKFRKINVVTARYRDVFGTLIHIEPLCFEHNANSKFFVEWFRKKLVKRSPRGSTIILDNATHHPKKKLANIAKRHGLKLLFLPSYSPDLNKIEKDWANMKKALLDILPNCTSLEQGVYRYFGVETY